MTQFLRGLVRQPRWVVAWVGWLMVASLLMLFLLALAACRAAVLSPGSAGPEAHQPETVIFLLRHAEALYPPPQDDPRNPPLNAMGQDRADALARLLSAADLDHLWSSEYLRTEQTAAPLAALLGLDVEPYDPGDLKAFAERLLRLPGRHLVVGHSNTTPVLVGDLGGDPGEPIDEEHEFDRLYVVIVAGSGQVTTTRLRYGDPTPDDWRERASTRR